MIIADVHILHSVSAGLVWCVNIYSFQHIVQDLGCQLFQIQVFLRQSNECIDTLHMIFLILYFIFKHFNLDSQFFLLLLIIIRQHLKTSFGQFSIDHILINTLEQSVQFSQTVFRFLQGSLFGRKLFLCFLTSLCVQCSAERILIISNTLDYQLHVLNGTFFQYHSTNEVGVADFLALFTGS